MDVAIKQLRNDRIEQGGYEKAKEEFFKEARIFKLMNHPNLVQVKIIFGSKCPDFCPVSGFVFTMSGFLSSVRICVHYVQISVTLLSNFDPRSGSFRRVLCKKWRYFG